MNFFSNTNQLGSGKLESMTIGDAVRSGMVANETIGYFMARTQMFMLEVGIHEHKIRFRQHLETEMAHYAADCWDCEVKTQYGWVECAGHADRACYDLDCHAKATNVAQEASVQLAKPMKVEYGKPNFNKKILGKTFQKNQKIVIAHLEELGQNLEKLAEFEKAMEAEGKFQINAGGQPFEITKEMVNFKLQSKIVRERKFTPSVIEPTFGIGRIVYCAMEHAFTTREEDEQRVVMRFSPRVAPTKCAVFNLLSSEEMIKKVQIIHDMLLANGLTSKADTSSVVIGRKYARQDELGTAFAVTVDDRTLVDDTVTLRERDTTHQIRIPLGQLVYILKSIVEGSTSWSNVRTKFETVAVKKDEGVIKIDKHPRAMFSRPAKAV